MSLRTRILEVAYELFAECGYDKTSVAQIIERVGTSKGNFYHHFKSKEDLLDAISLSYIETLKARIDETLSDSTLTVIDKFREYFLRLGDIKRESVKDWPKLTNMYSHATSHVFLKRFADAFDAATRDYYHKLILAGIESGEFKVQYPLELAELWSREVMQFYRKTRKAIIGTHEQHKELLNWLEFSEQLINQQLGLNSGTINLVELGEKHFDSMMQELRGRGDENDQMV